MAARAGKRFVAMIDFENAKDKVMIGAERRSMVLTQDQKEKTAYHEAGHAIVGELLPTADPIQKISIVSRGSALGYVLHMPTEDRYLKRKDELLDEICMSLGGRAAEEIVFNEISTGAANDLQHATQMAESMVKEYGMSERLGLVAHREDRSQQFLGMPNQDRNYSEETAREIDVEIARIIRENYGRAKQVLNERRDTLEKLVEILFEKEVMDGDELRQMMKEPERGVEVAQETEDAEGLSEEASEDAPQEVN